MCVCVCVTIDLILAAIILLCNISAKLRCHSDPFLAASYPHLRL